MSEKISDGLVKASEAYARNTALRAAVNLIPGIGGSLDVLFASKAQSVVQNRLMQFLEELRKEMNSVKEEMVDKQYLESEEWLDLVLRALEAATRTRRIEKISLYAKVLRGAVIVQDRQESSPEEYLAILAELTPREIEVAQAIYRQQNDEPQSGETELQWAWRKGWNQFSNICPSVPKEDVPYVLQRLERSGLLHEITGSYLGYGGEVYTATKAFRKLMRYLGP